MGLDGDLLELRGLGSKNLVIIIISFLLSFSVLIHSDSQALMRKRLMNANQFLG